MRKFNKRVVSTLLASVLAMTSLTGCGSLETKLANIMNGGNLNRVLALDYAPLMDKQTVIDNNAKELELMSHSTLSTLDDTTMEYNMVSTEMQQKLGSAIAETFAELNGKYTETYDADYKKMVEDYYASLLEAIANPTIQVEEINWDDYDRNLSTETSTAYLKSFFDNYKLSLTDENVTSMKEYSGYYFCTVPVTLTPNEVGTFNKMSNYLGLDNCFIRDENRQFTLNRPWIIQSIAAVNLYRIANKLEPHEVFISEKGEVIEETPEETVAEETIEESTTEGDGETAEGVTTEGETTESTAEETTEEVKETEAPKKEEKKAETYITTLDEETEDELEEEYIPKNLQNATNSLYTQNLRKLEYDVDEYELVNGSSLASTAKLPDLDMVYNPVAYVSNTQDTSLALVGNGCYKEGVSGLTNENFGFNADNTTGTAKIVLIYKQDEYDRDKIQFYTAYVESMDPYNPIEDTYNTTNYKAVPDFVEEKIEVKVEELDRLINNGDINGLMRHETIEDAGLALRYAEYAETTDLTTYSSQVQGVLDSDGNVYLVDVKTSVTEAVKDSALPVSYEMNQLFVIRQSDLNFYINDIYVKDKIITKAPTIDEVSQRYREIVNLNLADKLDGEQYTEVKNQITNTLLNDLTYSFNTAVDGGFYGDSYVSQYYGVSKQFNSNREVLSQTRYDYLLARLNKQLNLVANRDDAKMSIVVTKWLQGTDQQVEFETKELFYYPELGANGVGCYQECYYVVSHFRNRWVIDDIKTTRVEDNITGQTLADYITEFESSSSVISGTQCSDSNFQLNDKYVNQ